RTAASSPRSAATAGCACGGPTAPCSALIHRAGGCWTAWRSRRTAVAWPPATGRARGSCARSATGASGRRRRRLMGWLRGLWRRLRGGASAEEARPAFARQRPELEARFLDAARASGKPRGLRWVGLEWSPEVTFAREKATGQLAALVGVTIQFE